MKNRQLKNAIFVGMLSLALVGAIVAQGVDRKAWAEGNSSLPLAVQQNKSIELFHEIFQITLEGDKLRNLDRITDLYWQIITTCPDVPLAQESHWRLIESYFSDYQPPMVDEALQMFEQFKSRYPDSPLMNVVQYTMARGLYVNKYWKELLNLESPVVTDFFASGNLKSPLPVFYYAEANFHLNEPQEALKGYQALLDYFPNTRVAQIAAEKLAKMTQNVK